MAGVLEVGLDREVMRPNALRSTEASDALMAGDTHRAAEMYSSAIAAYQRALALENHLPAKDRIAVRLHLADCHHEVSQYDKAKEALGPLMGSIGSLEVEMQGRVLSRFGWSEFFLGNIEACRECCERSVRLLSPTSHHGDLASSLRRLGYAMKSQGDLDGAMDSFRDALAAARRSADGRQLAYCYEALGNLSRVRGAYSEAIAWHEKSLALNESVGNRSNTGADYFHLGLSRFYLGRWNSAEDALRQSERVFREISFPRGLIECMVASSRLCRRRGDTELAQQLASEALHLAQSTSHERSTILSLEELGDIAFERGDSESARSHYEKGLRASRVLAPEGDLVYEIAWRLARAHLRERRRDEAGLLADEAVRLAGKVSDHRECGHALATMAMIRADQKRFTEARALVERAIDEFRTIGTPYELAQTNEIAADILREDPKGSGAEILGHLFEARRLYGKLGAAKASDRVGKELEKVEASLHPDAVEPETREQRSAEDTLIFADDSMRKLVQTAKRAAPLTEMVLIQGETGTGKELIARLIHESGPRAPRPFVALNCAAMPENLLESQLFGHRKGAFTGATESHEGLLPSAKSGTVLLDEIDKATVEFHAKFLRVLDERAVRPVGAVRTVPLKARVICASNRDLKELVESRLFLPDLYFRIATITLQIPPLRERPADVAALVEHFLRKCDGRFGRERYELSRDAEYALIAYDWPGNVRELRNVMERAAFFAHETGQIELEHLPSDMREGPEAGNPEATLPERIASFERRHIVAALKKAKGVKSEAARVLGVSRKGLGDRLRRLGLQ